MAQPVWYNTGNYMIRGDRDIGRAANMEIEPQPWNISQTLKQLLGLQKTQIDLTHVLRKFNPDHVHWKDSGDFSPGPDLRRWLRTRGIIHFGRQKFFPDRTISAQETSRRLYTRYFRDYGIKGEIEVYPHSTALLDYHTGAKINPHPNGLLWPAESVVKLFPEVDFRIGVDCQGVSENVAMAVNEKVFILVNTSKSEGGRYRPHLLGYWGEEGEDKWMNILQRNKDEFLRRTDSWLKENGVTNGIDSLVVSGKNQVLAQTLLGARAACVD